MEKQTDKQLEDEIKEIEQMNINELKLRIYLYHEFMAEQGLKFNQFELWLKLRERYRNNCLEEKEQDDN
jgi:hypothetical protein